jgi:hypothetical protein
LFDASESESDTGNGKPESRGDSVSCEVDDTIEEVEGGGGGGGGETGIGVAFDDNTSSVGGGGSANDDDERDDGAIGVAEKREGDGPLENELYGVEGVSIVTETPEVTPPESMLFLEV